MSTSLYNYLDIYFKCENEYEKEIEETEILVCKQCNKIYHEDESYCSICGNILTTDIKEDIKVLTRCIEDEEERFIPLKNLCDFTFSYTYTYYILNFDFAKNLIYEDKNLDNDPFILDFNKYDTKLIIDLFKKQYPEIIEIFDKEYKNYEIKFGLVRYYN